MCIRDRGKAVIWFDDRTVLTEDVIALAKQYNANGADELLVFDLSDSDEDHEESTTHTGIFSFRLENSLS